MSGTEVDYDKQFQEDLEKAQALSLETFALEKIRLQQERRSIERFQYGYRETQVPAVQNNSSNVNNEPYVMKSRPRPGGGSRKNSILPPPVSAAARNNSTTLESSDLISFGSPLPVSTSTNSFTEDSNFGLSEPKVNDNETALQMLTNLNYMSGLNNLNKNIETPVSAQDYGFNFSFLNNDTSRRAAFSSKDHLYNKNINTNDGFMALPSTSIGFKNQYLPESVFEVRDAKKPNNMLALGYNQPTLDILKVVEKKQDNNLIDLARGLNISGSEFNVLEAFDPLATRNEVKVIKNEEIPKPVVKEITENKDNLESICSGSFYDPYDPFDYMYSPNSIDGSLGDPVYAAVIKEQLEKPPPPLPPRNSSSVVNSGSTVEKDVTKSRLYESIKVVKRRPALHDHDLQGFYSMVKNLRKQFVFSDNCTNIGLVTSPTIESSYADGTSIKLIVHSKNSSSPVTFTCNVNTTVEHVIVHVVCALYEKLSSTVSDYVLKVWALSEYLTSHTQLSDYEYVHQCMKLEQDVVLSIVHTSQLLRPLARTVRDDARDDQLTIEDLLPNEPVPPISYDTLNILLDTLEQEFEKIQTTVKEWTSQSNSEFMPSVQGKSVVQAVKAICAVMGQVETLEITESVQGYQSACSNLITRGHYDTGQSRSEILGEDGDYCMVEFKQQNEHVQSVVTSCDRIREAVRALIEAYCLAFRVDFHLEDSTEACTVTKPVYEIQDEVVVYVAGLHRLLPNWNHDKYIIAVQVYHGTRPVGHPSLSDEISPSTSFFSRVIFHKWFHMYGLSVSMLPRESRLVLALYGLTELPADHESNKDRPGQIKHEKTELGWTAIQWFNHEGYLTTGTFLLSLWPPESDKRLSPAPVAGTHPLGGSHPVMQVQLPDYGVRVVFPKLSTRNSKQPIYDFNCLDNNTRQLLLEITSQVTFSRPDVPKREVLWEKRHYLHNMPQALPKVLLAAHSWDYSSLSDLHSLIHSWSPMEPLSALQLLLPCFPDKEVRSVAISWIKNLGSDELSDYLPQLVQALKHETYEDSELCKFLLERALTSPRFAHYLYWLLLQTLPGQCPQNSYDVTPNDDIAVADCKYHRRLQLMLRALLAVSGEALRLRFMSQQLLVKNLYEAAEHLKQSKDSLKLKALHGDLDIVHSMLEDTVTCLPLSPSLCVSGVQVRTCSYFPSFTLPLKINFISDEGGVVPAIFKVGDDLRQDMLTLQMIRIMNKLWLKNGLDLKMVTFSCVPTGNKRGMIELVTDSETLRKIQVELGLTGSFKDRPIAQWLAKHNPSALEYERAVRNFTASCAGYSVATYILGICDRHNDNIMLKTSGHLFHIDFGKFLGDVQMFGNIKRDRTPFVLTSDMAFVINGGDKPTQKFQHFVDLCCQAFNIVRQNGNLLLNLFGMMVSSGIPGVTMDAVQYVQKALLLERSNPEAASIFAKMIESSLKSWFTQFNFFLHNLAQLRFSGEHNEENLLLSFIPKTYTMEQDGRIRSVTVHGCQKRYDQEKYYTYILKLERDNQPDPTYLFRTYREFCELHQKLCIMFPLAKVHSLSGGLQIGRSNIKQVAERRQVDIEKFLVSLFRMADEISHSDIVYTFFHSLLRDQQEADINMAKVKESKTDRTSFNKNDISGQLKLSVHYQRGTLLVMVHHARGLNYVSNGQEPSTYVKVYLLPDHDKTTKRKTKVVRRTCHPTFMENLEYRMSLEVIQRKILQATIWNHDSLQENEFLGGVEIPLQDINLNVEYSEWYSLRNVHR